MAFNPCCCMPLPRGARLMSQIDVVISILGLAAGIFNLVFYLNYDRYKPANEEDQLDESERRGAIIGAALTILFRIGPILLATRLFMGVKREDYKNVRMWIIITAIVTLINIITYSVTTALSEFNWLELINTLLTAIYKIYEMIVIYAFLQIIKDKVDVNYNV